MCGPSLTETSLCDAWLYHALTSSMEQSPSWEANRFSTNQEIPRILGNPNVHYRIQKCPPPVPIRTLLLLFILNMLHYFPVQSQRNLFFSGTDLNGISLIFRYRSQRNFCSFPVQISAEFLLFSGTYLSGISLIFRYISQRNFSYFPVHISAEFLLFSGTDPSGFFPIFRYRSRRNFFYFLKTSRGSVHRSPNSWMISRFMCRFVIPAFTQIGQW